MLKLLRVLKGAQWDPLFNVPDVDRLLHHPTQSGYRPRSDDELVQIDALKKALQKPNVVEITSEEPGAGKTHLLYLITTIAVLPHSHGEVTLNGNHSTVVVVDTDDRFSIERLAQVMKHYINLQGKTREDERQEAPVDAQPLLSETTISDLISTSLRHTHIFRPQSLTSAISTLQSLSEYLLNETSHHSSNRPLHSIMIDSLTAFYWPLRAFQDNARLASLDHAVYNSSQPTYAQLVNHLRSLAHRFSCSIIATSTNPFSSATTRNADAPGPRHFLSSSWSTFSTLRLHVARQQVPKFAYGLSIEEAVAEKDERWKEVEKGRFEALIDGSSGGRLVFSVKEGVGVEP